MVDGLHTSNLTVRGLACIYTVCYCIYMTNTNRSSALALHREAAAMNRKAKIAAGHKIRLTKAERAELETESK